MPITAPMKPATLLTIGYEGLDLPKFIKYLTCNKVTVLVDVRELAFSRKKGFSKTALSEALGKAGIEYRHLRALGSPRDVRKKLYADKDYDSFFEAYGEHLDEQDEAIAELEAVVEEHGRACVMCFEHDHTTCHRSHLAESMNDRFEVEHIKTFI